MKKFCLFALFSATTLSAQEYDTTTILVKHRATARNAELEDAHTKQGGQITRFKHFGWSAIKMPSEQQAVEARKNYGSNRLFEKVQFARIYRLDATPNDPLYPQMWGLQKIQAPRAWDQETATDVIVAVIDTGVDFNHPDLRDNLWTGPNGEHGYTASGGFLTIGGQDDHSHGTHVAGTIGAVGNNGTGLPGVNWRVKILSLKFLGEAGFGSSAGAALCIDKMIELKEQGHNIRVSNNSWGAFGEDPLLEEAFHAAEAAGILNICAAGNDGRDTDFDPHVPSSLAVDGIVSVLASDQNDNKAGFSNYGAETTDILAPGVNILSTRLREGYWALSGTSMATPHVAGVCAAMFGLNQNLTPTQCKAVLLDANSYDLTAFPYNSTGGGRLNYEKAVSNPKLFFPPPDNGKPTLTLDPTNLVLVQSGGSKTITATGFDPDGDLLVSTCRTRSLHLNDGYLIWATTSPLLRDRSIAGTTLAVSNIPSAREFAVEARFAVSDGRGGATTKRATFFTERDESRIRSLPVPTLRLVEDGINVPMLLVTVPGIANEEAMFAYNLSRNGAGIGEGCCFPVNTAAPIHLGLQPGINMFRVQVMDTNGNYVESDQLVVDVGDTGKYVPNARVSVNTVRGPAPLEVIADMSATDPSRAHGLIYEHQYWKSGGVQTHFDINNPVRRFTLTEPGLHAVQFLAIDDSGGGISDSRVVLFTVLPSGRLAPPVTNAPPTRPPPDPAPPDPAPPDSRLIAPQDLRAWISAGYVLLTWSDTSLGEERWELQFRSKGRGPWTSFRQMASLSANTTSYSFVPQRNTRYEFRLSACKGRSCPNRSNTASLRVP